MTKAFQRSSDLTVAEKQAKASLFGMLREILSSARGPLWEAVFMSLATNLIAMSVPIFVMQIYDRVVIHKGIATLQGLVIGMGIVILFDTILRFGRARLFQRIGLAVDVELGRTLYDKLMRLPLSTLESRNAPAWHSAFRDVETVRQTLAGPSMLTFLDLPFAVLFLFVIFNLSADLTVVFLFLLPFYVLLAFWSGYVISKLAHEEREMSQSREGLVHEILVGRSTIKSLALGPAFKPRFENAHADTIRASIQRGASADFHQVLAQSMTMGTTVTLTCVGALLILEQELSMGTLIAVNMLSARLVQPIAGLVGQWRLIQSFVQSIDRLAQFFALPSERPDAALPLDRPTGRVKLDNINYVYEKDGEPVGAPALKKLSGVIGPCGLHCLVGRNGAGKSTLLKVLAGLLPPNEGRVFIDGADIAQFSRADLASWVGYLPQECVLFAGTIKSNIIVGNPARGDEGMIASAKAVGVHGPILALPDGYDTPLSEGGSGLSAGQRRRIALARALMTDPPVILLDEPSADLDHESEHAMLEGLRRLATNHTVIIATHAPAVLSVADSVLILDQGQVEMAGPAKKTMTAWLNKIGIKPVTSVQEQTDPRPTVQQPANQPQASQAQAGQEQAGPQQQVEAKPLTINPSRQAALNALRPKSNDQAAPVRAKPTLRR